MEELARQRFYWPYMRKNIEYYIRNKCACVASKKPNVLEKAPLIPIEATYPFEMVCIDFLHLDRCKGGYEYILVVTDHFTRFTQAYATKTKSSKAAATKLFNEFILQFGFPKRIHHDRGGEFNSKLFRTLHRLSGIKSSNTTPYHPMGDGQVERMNRTLCNMLKAIPDSDKQNWKDYLPKLTFAYNSTVNRATGYSPFFLMFGRNSRLPIDSVLPLENNDVKNKTYKEFITKWDSSMKEAFQIANDKIKKSSNYNKKYYDSKIKYIDIDLGDRVLMKNVEKGGTGKLKSFWEKKIYEVIAKQDLIPVYTIKSLEDGIKKTVHRNLLMKVYNLPLDVFRKSECDKVHKKKIDTSRNKRDSNSTKINILPVNDVYPVSDDDSEIIVVHNKIERSSFLEGRDMENETAEEEKSLNENETAEEEKSLNENMENDDQSSLDETFFGFEENEIDDVNCRIAGSSEQMENPEMTSNVENEEENEGKKLRRSKRNKPRKILTYDRLGKSPKLSRYGEII